MVEVEKLVAFGKRPLYTVIAALTGGVVGWIMGPSAMILKPVGEALIMLLKFIVGPLIFISIATAIATAPSYRRLGKIAGGFFIYWAIFAIIAAIIGFTWAQILKPGVGVELGKKEVQISTPPSVVDILLSFIPTNPITPFIEINGMQLIVMAVLVGVAIILLGSVAPGESESLRKLFVSLEALTYKLVDIVLWYAPIGVFALMAKLVGTVGVMGLAALGKMVLTQWIAYLTIMFVIHPIFMLLVLRINPLQFWRKIYPAMLTAFVTQSSSATVPVTLRVTKSLGVPSDVADIIVPLGATIDMQAVSAEMPIYAVWVAQMYGATLTPTHIAIALLWGVFGAAACAGIPGGGIVIAALTLQSLGFPLEPVGWIAGIYIVIDVLNTTLNVTGDPLASVAVAKLILKEFDEKKFYAPPE